MRKKLFEINVKVTVLSFSIVSRPLSYLNFRSCLVISNGKVKWVTIISRKKDEGACKMMILSLSPFYCEINNAKVPGGSIDFGNFESCTKVVIFCFIPRVKGGG